MPRFVFLSLAFALGCHVPPKDVAALDGAAPAASSPTASGRAAAWDGSGDFQLVATDFHFELGGTQVVAISANGSVRDLFVRHGLEPVSVFCKNPGTERREACADLRKNGDKEVGTTTWFLARYVLSPAERDDLRARLVKARLTDLESSYAQKGVEDGTTRTYRLEAATGSKRVSVYSANEPVAPAALEPVIAFVRTLETTHAEARTKAPAATPDERKELEGLQGR